MKPFRQLALAAIAAALSALASLAVAGEDPAAVRLDDDPAFAAEGHVTSGEPVHACAGMDLEIVPHALPHLDVVPHSHGGSLTCRDGRAAFIDEGDDAWTIHRELHASARPLRIWKPPVPAGIGPEI